MYEQTTMATVDTAKPRNERDTDGPKFFEEPEQEVFVTPTEPVSIVCDVKGMLVRAHADSPSSSSS